tara:strand:+ start:371 stop:979 length:609 start_codon:yes stop_codon:yes gene_type:complete
MATRDKPNSYFAWYNDDDRLAIVERQLDTNSSKGIDSGEYDSFYSGGNLSGSITASTTSSTITFTSASHGLAVDDTLTISDTTSYDGDVTVTAVTTNTFSIAGTNSESSETGSWVSLFVDDGIRMTIHSKYEEVTAITTNLDTTHGLDNSMHASVLDYVKSRVSEDMGQMEQAQFFRTRFEASVSKKTTRRSGVRFLSVPKL